MTFRIARRQMLFGGIASAVLGQVGVSCPTALLAEPSAPTSSTPFLNAECEGDSLVKMVVALMDDHSPSSERDMFLRMRAAEGLVSQAGEPGADVFDVLQRGIPSVDWSKFDHLRMVS